MRKKIPYIEWRNSLLEQVPPEERIGADLLLLKDVGGLRPMSGPLVFDVTTVVFVMEGYTDIVINMKKYRVEAPAFFVMLPDVIVQFMDASKSLKAFCIIMSNTFFRDMLSDAAMSFKLHNLFYNDPVAPMDCVEVFTMYRDLLCNLLHSPEDEYKMEAARHLTLTIFYGYMLRRQSPSSDKKTQLRQESILEEFLTLLRVNYAEHRDVGFYADKLCLTAKYLSTAVKEASGRTPLDWIDEYVTMAAKAMLKSSNMSIDEISVRLNFGSLSLFGKFFRRVTGLSPRAYRNGALGESENN